MNELVSIIMPSYNTAQYIEQTINSVIAQTYKNWELIIVDDCSKDNTDEIVAKLSDERIKYLKNEKNSGAAVSRNRALREAKGKWIAFLDSDDLWHPEKLERQMAFMKSNGYYFSYTRYQEIDENGNETGVTVTGPKKISKAGMYNFCWPGCLTVMYDAEYIGLIQIEDIKKNNDYAMWLKVCQKADCHLLPLCLAKYRRGRSGSISTHSYKTLIKWHYKLYREAEHQNPVSSTLNTGRNLAFGALKKVKYVIKNKEIAVIGHFGNGKELLNGQTIKTKIVTKELENRFGKDNVLKIDTYGGKAKKIKLPAQIRSALKKAENVIIFPAQNGLRVIAPMLVAENKLYHRKLHYVVIGGWLPEFVAKRNFLRIILTKFDFLYVETSTMKNKLEEQGFQNVVLMPNCKNLKILDESELICGTEEPYKCCTFSRVMKEKGIEDAILAISQVNEKYGRTVFSLDIYGQIDQSQTEWFENLKKTFPKYVNYNGLVPFDKSTDVLKEYQVLLFPTYYEGEGFAGTLIDAFAAGLPIISSDWKYNCEIVEDGKNGYVFETHNVEMFSQKLELWLSDKEKHKEFKYNCIKKATQYLPENAIKILASKLI